MTLSDFSVKNPVFAWMLMFGIMIFGWIAFNRLGISQFPDVDFPVVTVTITRPGASVASMESDVTSVVEDAVLSIDGIRQIISSSREGRSTITIEFNLSKDMDVAVEDVRAKISEAQRLLPNDIDPPVISKTSTTDQPIMWVALTGFKPRPELSDYARFVIKPKIQAIAGVAEVGIGEIILGGVLARNVRIWIDHKKLQKYYLTVEDVISAIKREHIEIAAGRIEGKAKEFNIRFQGEASNLSQLENLIIYQKDGAVIYLKDVAVLENGLEDVRRIGRVNGVPSQGLGIKKMRGANEIEVAKAVKKEVEKIKKELPPGLNLEVVFDSTKYVKESIGELEFSIVLSVIVTAIVIWLFLGSFSATLNVILAIPTSILGAFAVMYFSGFTLNTITLMAISLSVGIIVDDAIMVLENIYRHLEKGLTPYEAALLGARQITFAALAATLAIVAIFLPIAFTTGIIGKFLFQFGITMSVAVLFSYLEAVTLTPARCSQILYSSKTTLSLGITDKLLDLLKKIYSFILPYCIKARYLIVIASFILFGLSLKIVKILGKELVPSQDQSTFIIRLQTPIGSSLDYTDQVVKKCEKMLSEHPEVDRYYGPIGGFGGGEVDTAVMFVTLVPPNKRKKSHIEMMQIIRKEFGQIPGLKTVILDLSQQGPQRGLLFPVEFTLEGFDWEVLTSSALQVMKKMQEEGIYIDIDTDYRPGMPEIKIFPDRKKLADRNIPLQTVANTIAALVGGVDIAKFEDKGQRYDIRVKLLKNERLTPHDIDNLTVRAPNGELIKLTEFITMKVEPSLQVVYRRNRQRAISITSNIKSGVSQAYAINRALEIAKSVLPEGYRVELRGGAQQFGEVFENLLFALILGIVIAYMILASQFNSFIHPFTILIPLPFSLTGALIGLWLHNKTINFLSMIGIILLMGIVKKNSIILVDFTNQLRAEGLEYKEALLKACPIRLRPIFMTALTTVIAAIPPALALGPGGELRVPMAITIIYGVSLSTFLTLFIVPSIYCIFEDFKKLFAKK